MTLWRFNVGSVKIFKKLLINNLNYHPMGPLSLILSIFVTRLFKA